MGLPMYLEAFSDNPFDTNCWLVALPDSDEALVVDPGFFPDRVRGLLDASGKRPVAVIATHGHYDHIGAARELCGDALPFYIHKDDELALTDMPGWGSGFPAPPIGRPIPLGSKLPAPGSRIAASRSAGESLKLIDSPKSPAKALPRTLRVGIPKSLEATISWPSVISAATAS